MPDSDISSQSSALDGSMTHLDANSLTHLDAKGQAHMVDVADKLITHRSALAQATVRLTAEAMQALIEGNNKKGDVLATARIAGIQASKQTSLLIPLCHPLPLTKASIDFEVDREQNILKVLARCETQAVTGVEMEAMTAASVSALTVYDMCKAVDKGIAIEGVFLIEKTGGKSGDWARGEYQK